MTKPQYCPKSDEGVRSAVKQGALVVGFGKSALPVADSLRAALGYRACAGDGWEESKVNHLVVVEVVENRTGTTFAPELLIGEWAGVVESLGGD